MREIDPNEILSNHLQAGDAVIVGVSGGPDSVFLLDLCIAFARKTAIKVVVAHVNHGLRGAESNDDAKFVGKIAREKKLGFEMLKLKKLPAGNLEEVCRNARYDFFEKLRRKHKAAWILTAHQQNDLIETVLFNLVRGSFLDGLKGMETADEKRRLLRPLLGITKEQILAELKAKRVPYRIDSSNKNSRFSRNLIRNEIIPLLKKINPAFQESMIKNVENIAKIRNLLAKHSDEWIRKNNAAKNIPLKEFLAEPLPMQKNLLAELYKRTHGNTVKFNGKHLQQIIEVLHKKKAGIKKEFGDGCFITIKWDQEGKNRLIQVSKKSPP